MRTLLIPLILALAACQQNPNYQPTGEDEPFRRSGNRRANADAARAVRTGHDLANSGMTRAEDPMMQNLRIKVTHIDDTHAHYQRLSKQLSYSDGKTRVAAGRAFRRNGFAVSVVSGKFAFGVTGTNRSGRRTRVREQMLTVLNRHTGSIQVANLRRRLRVIYRTPAGDVAALETLVTGARLVVSPEIVDVQKELVRVRLWPELADLERDGSIEVSGIETSVVVRNGQTILLGAVPEATRTLAYSWFSKAVGSKVRHRMMLLTVNY